MLTEEKYSNEYDLDGIRSKKVSVVTKYNINSGSGGGTVMSGGDSIQAVVKPPINQPEKKLISKTTKTHTYLTQNGKVMRDTLSTTVLQTKITRKTEILDFVYDESGRPFALIYTNGADDPITYYYVLNLQGDVVALTDSTGAIVVEYAYNAWGKVLTSTTMPECATPNLASINPLRYRGYYYDTETKFYYLQSRYYDPANHRFINADTYSTTDKTDAIACNMFVYCGNNPVRRSDTQGTDWKDILNGGLDVLEWLVDGCESVGQNIDLCFVQGFSGNASPGAFDFVQSIAVVFDARGNIAIQGQHFTGGITTNAAPSASFVTTSSIAFAPRYKDLEGKGYNIGGSYFSNYYGLGGGFDINFYEDKQQNKAYFGMTASPGIGAPCGSGEGHVNWGNTYTIAHINIYRLLRKGINKIRRKIK